MGHYLGNFLCIVTNVIADAQLKPVASTSMNTFIYFSDKLIDLYLNI